MTSQISPSASGAASAGASGAGTAPDVSAFGTPHPELDGVRVRKPGTTEIFLMDQGFLHFVPDNETYDNLFVDRNGIRDDLPFGDLSVGTPLASGSLLVRGIGTSPVYLFDGSAKRFIVSNAAMDKYHFSFKKIVNVPIILLRNVPGGPDIKG